MSALRTPPYDPRAHETYKGLVLASPTTQGLAAFTWMAPVAATTKPAASADDPVEAPTAAPNYWLAMGVVHALGCPQFHRVCVYACVLECV